MKKTDIQETQEAIDELIDKKKKMVEDRENKCRAAKEQLVDMVEVTSDKYRTATGVAEALRVLRFVYGEKYDVIDEAMTLAKLMAEEAAAMAKAAKSMRYDEMDKLCDGFYDSDFVSNEEPGLLAFEMMRIDLCRNVGGAAEDMVSFYKRAEEEIKETEDTLEDLKMALAKQKTEAGK